MRPDTAPSDPLVDTAPLDSARRRFVTAAAAGAGLAIGLPRAARAQGAWPSKSVRLIVPYPPGGGSDVHFRLIAQRLAERLGQPFVIENRAGAAGAIGFKAGAQAAPDGYTVTGLVAPIVLNPFLMKDPLVDPVKEFLPVATIVSYSLVMIASPSFPARTLAELIDLAKARPGEVSYGSIGGTSELALALLTEASGARLLSVRYKGAADQATAVAGAQVNVSAVPPLVAKPLVDGGRVRAIAYFGQRRNPIYRDVPTVGETYPGVASSGWLGFAVPVGTPHEVVDRLHRATADVLREPAIREQIAAKGDDVLELGPGEFLAMMKRDLVENARLVKIAGLTPQ